MEWTVEQTQSAINAALRRAATDMEFRKLALSDPAAAVARIAGQPLPEGFRVRVLEREGYDATIVLQDPVEDGELSDSELEHVAGGSGQLNLVTWLQSTKSN
jgi:hypothetical protein